MFAEQKVAKAPIETSAVREGENFESHTKGIWECDCRGYFSVLKDRVVKGKGKSRKSRGGNVFDSGKEKWGEGSERGWAENNQGSPILEPPLVEMNRGQGKNEVTQPVGQTEKVVFFRGGGGRNHKVTSGKGSAGRRLLVSAKYREKPAGFGSRQNRFRPQRQADPHHNPRC